MDAHSWCSDPYPFGTNPTWADVLATSPLSDACTRHATHSDEDVILASSRPKKRAGRKKFKETRHPVYRGVRRRDNNKWVCELREPKKKSRIWLGTYPTAEMAARAHDVAALALRGHQACLNFADSVWRLPAPISADARDIRKAAVEAAEEFRPSGYVDVKASGSHNKFLPRGCVDFKASDEASSREQKVRDEVSGGDKMAEKKKSKMAEDVYYMDEEAVFCMPGLLASMAEGLLLSPPPRLGAGFSWEESENDIEVSLWSYSI